MLSGLASFAPPSISTSPSLASPISPPRTGRFRGLSYLRAYTSVGDQATSSRSTDTITASPVAGNPETVPTSLSVSSSRLRLRGESSLSRPPRSTQNIRSQSPGASRARTGGWLPSGDGCSDAARATTQLQPSTVTTSRRGRLTPCTDSQDRKPSEMTRHRSTTSLDGPSSASLAAVAVPVPAVDLSTLRGHLTTRSGFPGFSSLPTRQTTQAQLPVSSLPSIQFVPYHDTRSSRPSLAFPTVTRTLPTNASIIRVGRYSEKENVLPNAPQSAVSDAPVGFKSKVVSRRHCEFFYMDNRWHIKDVKSSSGTFLNHIRLSAPGEESRPFAIKDGDLVQLGIDFKGGEEMIFRCVKIQILCNRGWQKSLNKFNKSAHKQLSELQRSTSSNGLEAPFKDSTECTICLNSIAPCQSLFVAPCSHTWHFKCIRPMLEDVKRTSSSFQHFLCPNCRAIADLDADIEEEPAWEEDFEEDQQVIQEASPSHQFDQSNGQDETIIDVPQALADALASEVQEMSLQDPPSFGLPPSTTSLSRQSSRSIRGLNPGASSFVQVVTSGITTSSPAASVRSQSTPRSTGNFVPRPIITSRHVSSESFPQPSHSPQHGEDVFSQDSNNNTTSLDPPRRTSPNNSTRFVVSSNVEGPMTPTNHAGPFVFDGAADGVSGSGAAGSGDGPVSLNRAAAA